MQVKQTQKNPRPGDGTPGPGRPKGVPNKTTALLKDGILMAAEVAGGGEPDGLVKYLVAQARRNSVAFMTLLGKVPIDGTDAGSGQKSRKNSLFRSNT